MTTSEWAGLLTVVAYAGIGSLAMLCAHLFMRAGTVTNAKRAVVVTAAGILAIAAAASIGRLSMPPFMWLSPDDVRVIVAIAVWLIFAGALGAALRARP